jgi:hypothetical protein
MWEMCGAEARQIANGRFLSKIPPTFGLPGPPPRAIFPMLTRENSAELAIKNDGFAPPAVLHLNHTIRARQIGSSGLEMCLKRENRQGRAACDRPFATASNVHAKHHAF